MIAFEPRVTRRERITWDGRHKLLRVGILPDGRECALGDVGTVHQAEAEHIYRAALKRQGVDLAHWPREESERSLILASDED